MSSQEKYFQDALIELPKEVEEIFKRKRDPSFDFSGIPASTGLNGIHSYPAMLHYLVVRNLLLEYSEKGASILDPFLGSGVTAVECLINNRNFIGCDINPLAILIAQVRIVNIPVEKLLNTKKKILKMYSEADSEHFDFKNIDFWFTEKTKQDLTKLRRAILNISSKPQQNFYKVVFSDTVRKVSNTRYNEFKLFRKKNLAELNVLENFKRISDKYITLLNNHNYFKKHTSKIKIIEGNILNGSFIEDNSIDLVITSPPYGDSKTTVAYGQFSRLSLQWLGMEEKVDKASLGSGKKDILDLLPSAELYKILNLIEEKDRERAKEVFSFYQDLYNSIKVISAKVKIGGIVCFIVGNRRVKGYELATDKISADFFEAFGFEHKETLVRKISNKRMPSENSPSNITGVKDKTMRYEYIVILEKR